MRLRDKELFHTNLKLQLPTACYGRIAAYSDAELCGLLTTAGGVIDEDFRRSIGVVVLNHFDHPFTVGRGDIIAQLICE